MKKILFLTHQTPFPPASGGAIKRWKTVEYLAGHHRLGLAHLHQGNDGRSRDAMLARLSLAEYYTRCLAGKRSPANLLKSMLHGMPLSQYRSYSPEFKAHIFRRAAQYEVLFFDSHLMFQYLPPAYTGRVILHAHNAEHIIWQQYGAFEKNPLLRLLVLREARLLRQYERRICLRADAVLAAPGDRDQLVKIGAPADRFHDTRHLGNAELLHLPDIGFDATEEALLSIGSLGWAPNEDGLAWFIRQVWPGLKARHRRLKFYIVGAGAGPKLQKLCAANPDIILAGFVDDLEPYYAQSRVFVAPLRFGSGMKVKIINALYRGIPVVTTARGIESLAVEDGRHIAVADMPEVMLEACSLLLEDRAAWEELRNNSRIFAGRHCSWQPVFENIEKALHGT